MTCDSTEMRDEQSVPAKPGTAGDSRAWVRRPSPAAMPQGCPPQVAALGFVRGFKAAQFPCTHSNVCLE
eukprot:c43638_g1_i1 orf=105-311(+)